MEAGTKMEGRGSNAEPQFETLWPLARLTTKSVATYAQLRDVNQAKIGFVWDYMFRGDEIFHILRSALGKQYPAMKFAGYENFGNIHGPDERRVLQELPERLRASGVDAVVVAVGA